MTLSMLYLRLTLLSAFAIIVLICISYAHSNSYENTTITTLKGPQAMAEICNNAIKSSMPEKDCHN